MLREQDYKRIKREMDSVKGDAVEHLRARAPWGNPLDEAVLRVSRALREAGAVHVFYGLRALPFYGVPHLWGKAVFAVKSLEDVVEDLVGKGFVRVPGRMGGARLLDARDNEFVELLPEPRPLRWDEGLVERIGERYGVRVLSPEDYVVYLLVGEGGALGEEMAAKALYQNLGEIDRDYLMRRSEEYGVSEEVGRLLRELSRL